jgi:hypothetical protein
MAAANDDDLLAYDESDDEVSNATTIFDEFHVRLSKFMSAFPFTQQLLPVQNYVGRKERQEVRGLALLDSLLHLPCF